MQIKDDASYIEYRSNGDAAAFVGPDAVAVYAAATLASSMRLYAKTGMRASRFHTPSAMLKRAGEICGKTYKRNQMLLAADDVSLWVQTMKAALPAIQR
jgi:hypothetical protein